MTADFTTAEFLKWAQAKCTAKRYCYEHSGNCALAQFLKETGRDTKPLVGTTTWGSSEFGVPHRIPRDLIEPLNARPHSFGGLVRRIEQMAA